MDKEVFNYLEADFQQQKSEMLAKIESEEAHKLALKGLPINHDHYSSKLNDNVSSRATEYNSFLEKHLFTDFGGSLQAAQKLMEEKQNYTSTMNHNSENESQVEQKSASNENSKLEQQRNQLREQFRNRNSNRERGQGRDL